MTGLDLHLELCSGLVGSDIEHLGLLPAKAICLIISQRAQHDHDSVLVMGKVSLQKYDIASALRYYAIMRQAHSQA